MVKSRDFWQCESGDRTLEQDYMADVLNKGDFDGLETSRTGDNSEIDMEQMDDCSPDIFYDDYYDDFDPVD